MTPQDKHAHLVLEDGSVYRGEAFGAARPAHGEVVFSTSMTGYQEMLTDPSFAGQIVVPTYPLIGNYGISERDFESARVQVAGFVVREHSARPSHALSTSTLDEFLKSQDVTGISGVDTRAITRRLRTRGVMKGVIAVDETPEQALARLGELPDYGDTDFVQQVSTEEPYDWDSPNTTTDGPEGRDRPYRILVDDCGLKYNILRMLRARGCEVKALPAKSTAEDILSLKPDGVLMSPGPGDPELLDYAVDAARGIAGKVPILGICLGNQMIGRAFGGKTFKLKFGHRGANHPVKDLETGRVYITAQNHGYAVDPNSLPPELEVSHVNLNDGTVEGLRHKTMPIMTIQYHSEASPGPLDNEYIFDRFIDMVRKSDV
ncbi:MAG: glutamine-hydrolyzing carbamoyl-phosphate synthase small subunit [Dehalococcoidia bacterium]|nr:glutamine-hydrolyzing carbamoyl-phosphate synthase small subunit [Dehalococcoidia bacterium]